MVYYLQTYRLVVLDLILAHVSIDIMAINSNYHYDLSQPFFVEPEFLLIIWDRGGNSFDYSIIDYDKFETVDLSVNPSLVRWLSYREFSYTELITEKGKIFARSSNLLVNFFFSRITSIFIYISC